MDKLNIIITKSNADTNSKIISDEFNNLAKLFPKKIFLVDSLGRRNYISTLKKCRFVIGNSSSGIIEAASFGKWVIDLGKRQMSRITSGNVINVKYKLKDILNNIDLLYDKKESFKGENIYYKKNTSEKIINIISRINGPLTQ